MITKADKLECVERELAMRQLVYPRLISSGKLTADKAAREIAIIKSIIEDYRGYVEPRLL